jgi:hypothetical protein
MWVLLLVVGLVGSFCGLLLVGRGHSPSRHHRKYNIASFSRARTGVQLGEGGGVKIEEANFMTEKV